jgi:hypothetical protein
MSINNFIPYIGVDKFFFIQNRLCVTFKSGTIPYPTNWYRFTKNRFVFANEDLDPVHSTQMQKMLPYRNN